MGRPVRIISFDPGTNKTGVAISEVSDDLTHIRIIHACTINLDKMVRRDGSDKADQMGDKHAKLAILKQAAYRLIVAWAVDFACSESPYMGSFPSAYAALTECLDTIRDAVHEYDPSMELYTIDPATVKKAMGVSGKSGDKNAMREAICSPFIEQQGLILEVDIDTMDEHAVDAGCVNYCYFRQHTG